MRDHANMLDSLLNTTSQGEMLGGR